VLLLAAERMGVQPGKCLVIEDSEMGILAAHAAGMAVWHFAGGAHVRAGYEVPTTLSIGRQLADMHALHQAFCEAGICLPARVALL
jgi:beta-phosphoglucomutase-like phosphatase (HAD superfamily)